MKIRRFHEIDVANTTALPIPEQRKRMFNLVGGGGAFSFDPTRDEFPDILNTQPEMFARLGEAPVTPYHIIADHINRACKSDDERYFNLMASRLLYDYFRAKKTVARQFGFAPLQIGLDRNVRFWISAYYGRDGRPVITYIDPRGGRHLTRLGRDVAFASMHYGVRERYPDFENAILQIIQLPYVGGPKGKDGHRKRELRCYELTGGPSISFEELDAMFTRTFILWDEVCASVAEEKRKKDAGKGGGFI